MGKKGNVSAQVFLQCATMSAFGGKADINHKVAEYLLIAISGHQDAA